MSTELHQNKKLKAFAILWIVLVHFFGIIGIWLGQIELIPNWFLPATPLTILVSAIVVLLRYEKFKSTRVMAFVVIAVLSFLIELYGVKSGNLFGTYTYGNNLGWKIFDVPIIIGVNWAVLIMVAQQLTTHYIGINGRFFSALSVATIMTTFDLLLEVLAPQLDFWSFTHMNYAPVENFVAWFAVSFCFGLFSYSHFRNQNRTAVLYGIAQLVFFMVLGLLII
jgi:putative membrane protein